MKSHAAVCAHQLGWKWAGLAVLLFSSQIPNGSYIFFLLLEYIVFKFFIYETIDTHVLMGGDKLVVNQQLGPKVLAKHV